MSTNQAQKNIITSLKKADGAKMGKFLGGGVIALGVTSILAPYSPGNFMVAEFAHASQNAGAFGVVVGSLIMASSFVVATAHENIAKLKFKKLVKDYGSAEEKHGADSIEKGSDMAARNVWAVIGLAGTAAATAATVMYPSISAAVGVGVLTIASTLFGTAANEEQIKRNQENRLDLGRAIIDRRAKNTSVPSSQSPSF